MASTPRPICVKCERTMIPVQNGCYAILMAYEPPKIYEVYHTDMYRCPVCMAEVLTGMAQDPVLVHYREDFDEAIKELLSRPREEYVYVFENDRQKALRRDHL